MPTSLCLTQHIRAILTASYVRVSASSLSDLKNRSENLTGRSQISSILKGNSSSIARESGGIWIVQADLQPISFKSDRLLDHLIFNALQA